MWAVWELQGPKCRLLHSASNLSFRQTAVPPTPAMRLVGPDSAPPLVTRRLLLPPHPRVRALSKGPLGGASALHTAYLQPSLSNLWVLWLHAAGMMHAANLQPLKAYGAKSYTAAKQNLALQRQRSPFSSSSLAPLSEEEDEAASVLEATDLQSDGEVRLAGESAPASPAHPPSRHCLHAARPP